MAMLGYRKTLDIVEKFMIDSRIREYCTKICKGHCCGSCYTKNEEACHRHEKRRLSCSIYLCTNLFECISKKDRRTIGKARSIILEQYHLFAYGNIYFSVPSKKFFRKSRFLSEIICELNEDIAKRINIIMAELINNNENVRGRRV